MLNAQPKPNVVPYWQHETRTSWLLPVLAAVLALAVRLHGLGDKPLWYDEVLTLKRAALPLAELAADSFHNKHYPLYFLLTKPFAGPNWTEAGLRLLPAVFGAMQVLFAARIAGLIAGGWAAVTTGLLIALSPMEVQYGQEARPYTLASAAIMAGLWGLVRLTATGGQAFGPVAIFGPAAWTAYAVGMVVAVNALGAAAPCFVSINLIVPLLWATGRLPARWPMRTWIFVNLAVLAAWLPSLAQIILANAATPARGLNWVPPLTPDLAVNVVSALYMLTVMDVVTFERLDGPMVMGGYAVVGLALFGAQRIVRTSTGLVMISLFLVMPLALTLISLAKPLFVPRYLLWSTGPYFVLAGIGVAAIPPLSLRLLVAAGITGAAMMALMRYHEADTKPRWDLAASYLAQHAKRDDVMVASSGLARFMLGTYMGRSSKPSTDLLAPRSKEDIDDAFRRGGTVWLVHGRAGQGGRLPNREALVAAWPGLGPALETHAFGRHIAISRHAKSGPGKD